MENSPFRSEISDSDKKESGKKKKKSAENLGVFAVEPERRDEETAKEESAFESLWRRLAAGREKSEKPADDLEYDTEANPTDNEILGLPFAGNVEELGDDERHVISRTLARARLKALAVKAPPEVSSGEATGADLPDQAATEFYRAVEQGAAPAEAEATALQELAEPSFENDAGETSGAPAPEPKDLLHAAETDEAQYGPEDAPAESPEAPAGHEPLTTEGGDEPPRPPRGPDGGFEFSDADDPWHGQQFAQPAAELSGSQPYGPTAAARSEQVILYQENFIGPALIGGIIGYLLGRRRGRIKTEKKLLPIQKKLEKQVRVLNEELAARETHIREVARKTQRQEHWQSKAALRSATEAAAGRAEWPAAKWAAAETDARETSRPIAAEAQSLHGSQRAPEHIGRVLVVAAENRPSANEQSSPHDERNQRVTLEKQAEHLSRAELLRLSNKIIVEGSSLREVYETHLISERGLRRLAAEYLRGGNVKKALRREMVEHQIDFERDPLLRDHSLSATKQGGGANLQVLLKRAGAANDTERQTAAVYRAQAAHQAGVQQAAQRRRRAMDISLISTIIVLIALVVLLLIFHK